LVIDPIGGSHWKKSYAALRHTGRLGMFGVSTASANGFRGKFKLVKAALQMPKFHPLGLLNKNRGVFGLHIGHLWEERRQLAGLMEMLISELHAGRLTPVVARTFPLESAPDAHRFIQSRLNIGKVVLTT